MGPESFSITVIPMLWDVFCNGGSFLADGRCMTFGGTAQYDPFEGDPRITVFDPHTDLFNQLQEHVGWPLVRDRHHSA